MVAVAELRTRPFRGRAEDTAKAIVARASALVPALRARTKETDTLVRLPDATVDEMERACLFDLMTPHRHGGLQTSVRTYKEAIAELGRGDASTAWAGALINVSNWMTAVLYPKHVTDEVFAGGGVRAAAVLSPRKAKVRRVAGGYIIEEGLWSFNSGVYHANWDLLGIPMVDEAGNVTDQGLALLPMKQVEILNDWDTIGIRGSGSSSVAVKDVFVPDERVASVSAAIEGRYNATHLRDEPLYRVAFVPMLAIILVFPALGAARAALETFLTQLPDRGIQYTWYERQAEAPVTHLQVGEASAKIDAAEAIVERAVNDLDRNAEGDLGYMDTMARARIRRDTGYASRLIWEAVDLLASAAGGSLAGTAKPLNRIWRDARITNLHGLVNTSTNLELYGRLLCGQPANTPLV